CSKWTMLDSIVRLWAFSSASKSQMLVPASTLGSPLTAPVLTSSLSANVVFPLPPWPHKAMLRMSSTLYLDMPVSFRWDGPWPARSTVLKPRYYGAHRRDAYATYSHLFPVPRPVRPPASVFPRTAPDRQCSRPCRSRPTAARRRRWSRRRTQSHPHRPQHS